MKPVFRPWTVLAATILVLLAGAAVAGDRAAEVDRFLEDLGSPSPVRRIEAAKRVTQSGLTDRRLFDRVDGELREGYLRARGNDLLVDEMSWFCKALASSGVADYKPTLVEVAERAPDPKLRRYAEQSLALVEAYARRNRVMAEGTAAHADLSPEVGRLIGMLGSGDPALQRDAAKTVTRAGYGEPPLYAAVAEALRTGAAADLSDRVRVDAMAWLCKALATSGRGEYRPLLESLARDAANEKLRRHASEALAALP